MTGGSLPPPPADSTRVCKAAGLQLEWGAPRNPAMHPTQSDSRPPATRRIRWWPAAAILLVAAAAGVAAWYWPSPQVQHRNMTLYSLGAVTLLALGVWWLAGSRAPWRARLAVTGGFLLLVAGMAAAFKFRGVTGDLVPILEPRWSRHTPPPYRATTSAGPEASDRPDFPQYLGPGRDGMLRDGPALASDWQRTPPQVVWRQPIGPAWAGFAIAGNRALTLEQRGQREVVVCLNMADGGLLWQHADAARYISPLGGEGPRTTPTVADGRVFTFGATGILNCLLLETGGLVWQRRMAEEAPGALPEWGYAGSPLVHGDLVIVSAGHEGGSMRAYRTTDGSPVWSAGSQPAGYASPMVVTLAAVPQVIGFNQRFITAHEPSTGAVLWEHPWGNRQPVVAQPLPVGPDTIVFSSGYGVGAELLRIARGDDGGLSPQRLWKSISLKAKMSSFIEHDGFLYGLDDGMLTCVDARDGRRRWKDGRYGHGQLLWSAGRLLVSAETGELVLLEPSPDGPGELARFPVFAGKTWNPPALSGDLLLMRTDREAVCLRLPVASGD